MQSFTLSGKLIDLFKKKIYPAQITVSNGIIKSIIEIKDAPDNYILPGFVDSHIHIESSMLVPTSFARMAVVHGTVATVSDPHEIANVCGIEGVEYMINNSKQTPFKFFFGAPSCVPATDFETAGAHFGLEETERLLQNKDIWYLSEMMNFPGVLAKDNMVMAKIRASKKAGKPIDGHAPGLFGLNTIKYANAGITTDHECFTIDEAIEKINAGMHILIREGSAAKNYNALCNLLSTHPDKIMFCSDDKHPDDLVNSHINWFVKQSIQKGYDIFNVLNAACLNAVLHYNLPVGLLRENDSADFIVVNNLNDFEILQTYISGNLVAENGKTLLPVFNAPIINNFKAKQRQPDDFKISSKNTNDSVSPSKFIKVIEVIDNQLVTNKLLKPALIKNGCIISDVDNDILKIAVINRYTENANVAIGFIKNFGLKNGAIASTVAHDCHNIICVGVDDALMCKAINIIIENMGGISIVEDENNFECLPLPVAGLMTNKDGYETAIEYSKINERAKKLGSKLNAPFTTLSFMALLVIPELKLSDKGLFDGTKFEFTEL